MNLSVIIPAFNAADTISETLDAVLAQTFGGWEVVIIDDGSTDGTASVIHKYAERDKRVKLVRQSNGGLSAARNTGIAAARYEYLLFLDADDWIAPSYIERFKEVFEAEPGIDAVVCGWQFVLENGEPAGIRYPPEVQDMFPYFSHTCPFVVHACVIHRKIIENAGVFDSSVGFVEDWDFWQRASRAGARFRSIKEVLAFYRMRKGSLSRKVFQSYMDARKMIYQGYAEDKRVSYPVEKYRYGMPDDRMKEYLSWLYCWYAGLCVGVGEDPQELTEADIKGFDPEPAQLAAFIFESVYRGGCFHPDTWLKFYQQHLPEVNGLFKVIELQTGNISAIHNSKIELFCMIARGLNDKQPVLVGEVLYIPVEIIEPVDDLHTAVKKVILQISLEEVELGRLELDVEGNELPATQIRKAISDEWSWQIMTRYLKYRYPGVADADIQGTRGWELFLCEFWGLNWAEPDFYDVSYVDNGEYKTREWSKLIDVEISEELFNVCSNKKAFQVDYYIGGMYGGRLTIEGETDIVSAQHIRAVISAEGKFDICRAAVNQGLIGRKLDKIVLREELKPHR